MLYDEICQNTTLRIYVYMPAYNYLHRLHRHFRIKVIYVTFILKTVTGTVKIVVGAFVLKVRIKRTT